MNLIMLSINKTTKSVGISNKNKIGSSSNNNNLSSQESGSFYIILIY